MVGEVVGIASAIYSVVSNILGFGKAKKKIKKRKRQLAQLYAQEVSALEEYKGLLREEIEKHQKSLQDYIAEQEKVWIQFNEEIEFLREQQNLRHQYLSLSEIQKLQQQNFEERKKIRRAFERLKYV